jgi:hypothetical protein
MDRLLRILFALLVAIGATGAELRLPQASFQVDMDCGPGADGTCPCGMPMPGPEPCTITLPSPMAAPTRTVTAVSEPVATADPAGPEPKPWPPTSLMLPLCEGAQPMLPEFRVLDTGPPLLASERAARLRVFRI